jgi:hypothetical protein
MTERVARGVGVLPAALLEQRVRSIVVGRDTFAVAIQLAEPVTCVAQPEIACARVQRCGALGMTLPLFL